jgi:hypothetical protein
MEITKPILGKSRMERLLNLVRPPQCECSWAVKASQEYELSDEQRQQLADAVWFAFRFNTKTLTPEDHKHLGSVMMAEFMEATEDQTKGWIGKKYR